eukprot:10805240-Lingulodinium_polyedra.AAC.1
MGEAASVPGAGSSPATRDVFGVGANACSKRCGRGSADRRKFTPVVVVDRPAKGGPHSGAPTTVVPAIPC